MKKQFFRVKQLADQTFLRADKSEDLNYEELQTADRKIEYLKGALAAICKKIPSDGPSQNETSEKRLKKYAEHQLGVVLLDQASKKFIEGHEHNGKSDDACELFRYILKSCGDAEHNLANEQLEHEIKIEGLVSKPLLEVLEKEIPNIIKLKRNLNKYILDKDSAKSRYNAAKHGQKTESIKLEMEEADMKVEQTRDALAAEMFSVLRKENELSQYILQILKLQRAYHESALKTLDDYIPDVEFKIGNSPIKPVFGTSLEEHLRVTKRKIAYPLEICICALTELGMSEEGLFRMGGGLTRVKRLKLSLDSGSFSCPLLPEYRDVHVIASTLKMYLRELPEPILTATLYNDWIESMKHPEDQRLGAVQKILRRLPECNRYNLSYLMQFLAALSKHPETKMNASNIAIVIAPNLLWLDKEMDANMTNCALLNMIVEFFVNKVDELFTDDFSQSLTVSASDLLPEEYEFQRPYLPNLKLVNENDNVHLETASPKPQHRRKKPAAPVPPAKTDLDYSSDRNALTASYPSGSSTLSRSHKVKCTENSLSQSTTAITDYEGGVVLQTTAKRRSLVLDDDSSSISSKYSEASSTVPLVNLDDAKTVDHKYVISQSNANIQLSTARPVQQVTAQITNTELPMVANNIPQKFTPPSASNKPVAAPRMVVSDSEKGVVNHNLNFKPEQHAMSKSLNSVEIDGEVVQIRGGQSDGADKPSKPAIPVRPASLRGTARNDAGADPTSLQKTQCSVYSVAHKQQPSIVNLPPNREKFQAGHDNQMAEKEKFLGHQPERVVPAPRSSLENKFNDINFNCDSFRGGNINGKPEIPSKPPHMKSNEMLHTESPERCNGNSKPSHIRTRSDGNIIDTNNLVSTGPPVSLLTTPPSPKSLNKPTQPPPPPPIVNKPKTDDSTDL